MSCSHPIAYLIMRYLNFVLRLINTKRFFALMGLAFTIPLLWWMPLFLHGNIIHGRVTSDLTMQMGLNSVGVEEQQITALPALEIIIKTFNYFNTTDLLKPMSFLFIPFF